MIRSQGAKARRRGRPTQYLVQLLLCILLAAQLVLGALPQPLEPLCLLFGRVDLVPQLLLQVHLLHLHRAVLLLCNLQPGGGDKHRAVSYSQSLLQNLNSVALSVVLWFISLLYI